MQKYLKASRLNSANQASRGGVTIFDMESEIVFHDGLSNLLRDVAIRTIVLLLIGGRLTLVPIPFVDFGVVRRRRGLLGRWFLRTCRYSTTE